MRKNMKLVYALIVLMIAASVLGCVGKKEAETATNSPVQTSVSPGEVIPATIVTPAADLISPAASQTPPGGEDIFGTESEIMALDTTFDDMNMEISLSDSI